MKIAIALILFMFGLSGNENGTDSPYPILEQHWTATCPSGFNVAHIKPTDEALAALTNPVRDPDDPDWYYYCDPMCGVNKKTGKAKHDCIIFGL